MLTVPPIWYTRRMSLPPRYFRDLYQLFGSVETDKEAQKLLADILTPQELDSLAERWQLIQLLMQGVPQRDIAAKLNVSISKITRGSRALQYGQGGFDYFVGKIKKKKRKA